MARDQKRLEYALAGLAFLALAAYWPTANFAEMPRWVSVCFVLGLFVLAQPLLTPSIRVRWTNGHSAAAALFGWSFLSLAWTPVVYDSLFRLVQLLALLELFLLAAELESLKKIYFAAALGLMFSLVVAVPQALGYHPVRSFGGISGLFGNKNLFGEAAAMLLPVVAWPFAGPVAIAVVLSTSKSALIGVGAAGALRLWHFNKIAACAVSLAVLAGGLHMLGGDRFHDIQPRAILWADGLSSVRPLGWGVGSFHAVGAMHGYQQSVGKRDTYAHNDLLQLAVELGAIGVGCALALAAAVARAPGAQREKYALVVFAVAGLVGFPFYCPVTACLAAIMAGHVCGRARLVRDSVGAGRSADARGRRHMDFFGTIPGGANLSARPSHPERAGAADDKRVAGVPSDVGVHRL